MGKEKTAIREVGEGLKDDRRLSEALKKLTDEHDPQMDGYDPGIYRRALRLLDQADDSSCSDGVHEAIQGYVSTLEDLRDEDVLGNFRERQEFAQSLEPQPRSPEQIAYEEKLEVVVNKLHANTNNPNATRARVLLDLAVDMEIDGRYDDGLQQLGRVDQLLSEPVEPGKLDMDGDVISELGTHFAEVNRKASNLAKRAMNIGLSDAAGMTHQYQMAMTLKRRGGPTHPKEAILIQGYKDRIEGARQSIREENPNAEDIYETYSDEDLKQLMKIAKHLDMDEKTLSDMLYIGSRKKKFRDVDALIAQFLNWRDFPVRKYPFKFDSKTAFEEFSNFVKQQLNTTDFAGAEVRVMGSSLRSRLAGDIDFSVIVDENGFNQHMQRIRVQQGIGDEEEDPSFIKVAKRAGFMKLALKDMLNAVKQKYPALKVQAIGLTMKGGPFDLSPAIPL